MPPQTAHLTTALLRTVHSDAVLSDNSRHAQPKGNQPPLASLPLQPSSRHHLELLKSLHSNPASLADTITVLLIDDQVIIGEAVRRILATESDIVVHHCSDPTQALQMALDIQPTIILQDLVMPSVDGMMLLRWFRNHPSTRDIPIVVLSTKEESMLKAESFAQGANDYLVKLPDRVELTARIRYHARAYNTLRALSVATTMAQQQAQQLEQTLAELQKTQAQLIQTEKMSSLGQLVACVAHEINNPVNFIHGNISHARDYVQTLLSFANLCREYEDHLTPEMQHQLRELDLNFLMEDLPKLLSSMKVGTDRIQQIVLSLRNFSRLDEADMKPVDIHEGIDSTLLILHNRLKPRAGFGDIQIVKEYGDLPLVECYAGQLNQVFMNLLSNAIDAVEAYQAQVSQEQCACPVASTITIRTQVYDDSSVIITIADNGAGMAAETIENIFQPFFTTKPVGKGTGLGLSISHQIIAEKHHGTLQCHSELGKGTEFRIEIPIHQNPISA